MVCAGPASSARDALKILNDEYLEIRIAILASSR